jgi:hypothetical protein
LPKVVPKVASHFYKELHPVHFFRQLQPVLCQFSQESVWLNEGGVTEKLLRKGPVFAGSDYRMLVTLRCPFKYIVSSYTYFGLRGAGWGSCTGETNKGADSEATEPLRIREILDSTATLAQWKNLPKLPEFNDDETYHAYVSRISVHDGVLVEMLRSTDHLNSRNPPLAGPFTRVIDIEHDETSGKILSAKAKPESLGPTDLLYMLQNAHLTRNNDKVKGVCFEATEKSIPEFDKTMQGVAEFMQLPGASSWHENMRKAFRSIHRRPFPEGKFAQSLAGLVHYLDLRHFHGYLSSYALEMQCAKLPSQPTKKALASQSKVTGGAFASIMKLSSLQDDYASKFRDGC